MTSGPRCLFLVSFPALLLLLCIDCGRESPVPEPLIVCSQSGSGATPNASRFGLFAPEMYQGYDACVDSLARAFGVRPGYYLWFQAIGDPFPTSVVVSNTLRSAATVISLSLSDTGADSLRNDTLLREITLGLWDSVLDVFADSAAATGVTIYLRFGYEMNGTWFPWGGKASWFIAAWNHAHALFALRGATNVRWLFAPGIVWDGLTVAADILPYYPGDSVVDGIGLDGYNYGDNYDQWHHWESFASVFATSLQGIKNLGKPLWITEIGCPTDPRRPAWLGDLFTFMDENPCIEACLYFNAHKSGEPDFRLQSDTASLDRTRAWLAR